MNKLFLIIVLCACMLNANAQDNDDVSTSQTIASLLETQPEKKVKEEDESFAISIGTSSIQSKIYSSGDVYTKESGLDAILEYDYIKPSGFGFGVTIAFNRTTLTDNTCIKQLFFGPSIVYAGYLGTDWWAKVDLGLGYGNLIEDNAKITVLAVDKAIRSGLGCKSSVSFDYMVSPTIGIGVQLVAFTTYFGKSNNGRDEASGISRLGFSICLRKHL